MKCVIYARISSEQQNIDNSSQAQIKSCKEYAEKNNFEIQEIYIDKGESGKVAKRPEFQRMITDAKQKKFQIILVHKFDRFARNREDSVIYKSLLKKYKIELISVSEPLGDGIYSKLIEGILEVTAEFYSLNLGEEVKKGQRQVIERGFHPCGKPPLGYKRKEVISGEEKHTILELDPDTAPIIKKIFELSASGSFLQEIQEYLNSTLKPYYNEQWDNQSIHYILKNRKYTGSLSYSE